MLSELQLTMFLNGYSPLLLKAAYYISNSIYLLMFASIFFAAKNSGAKNRAYSALIIASIYIANSALKTIFEITRPNDDNLILIEKESGESFPSGHAALSFGSSAVSGRQALHVWALLISISRLILGVHYPSDVMAGAVLGYAIGKLGVKYEKTIFETYLSKEHAFETRRKLAHGLLGIPVAAFVYLAPKTFAGIVLAASVIILLLISHLAKRGAYVPLASGILRVFERKKDMENFPLKGSVFFMSGALISVMLYKTEIAAASVIILALGDSFSTLVGKPFGKTRHIYNPGKSVEGSIAGLIAAFIGAAFIVSPLIALAGAFSGMLVESLDLKLLGKHIDDNFSIPVICGAVMAILAI